MNFYQLLPLFVMLVVRIRGDTPFCDLCPCNSQPNHPPNINCMSANITNIYEKRLWTDEKGEAYSIASLTINYNNLNELRTQFPRSGLKVFDLSHNFINNIGSEIFAHMQDMTELYLGNNNIETLNPDVFRGVYNRQEYYPLRALRILDLKYNKLSTLNADVFEHIDELEELNLSNNPIKIISTDTVAAIASLIYLKVLNLSYTQIKALPDNFLHVPKHLTIFDISGNYIEEIPHALSEGNALEALYLNNNPIKKLSNSNIFPKIATLKKLQMSHMPILEAIDSEAFYGLTNLEELIISKNPTLYYIHPNIFLLDGKNNVQSLPLKKLIMCNNNISFINNRTLMHLNDLQEIDFYGNPWECECNDNWTNHSLISIYKRINKYNSRKLTCKYPTSMEGVSLDYLYNETNKIVKSCPPDMLKQASQEESLLLIAIISGILTITFLIVIILYFYRTKLNYGPNSSQPRYGRIS